jgi:hypothetical protein
MLENKGVATTNETAKGIVILAAYSLEGAIVVLLKQALQLSGLVTSALPVVVGEMRRGTVSDETVDRRPDGDDGKNES